LSSHILIVTMFTIGINHTEAEVSSPHIGDSAADHFHGELRSSIAGGNHNVNVINNHHQSPSYYIYNSGTRMSRREQSVRPHSGKRSLCFASSFAATHWLLIPAYIPTTLSPRHSTEAGSAADTYARILLTQRIGYPLWRPTPAETPSEHRRKGVSIGDVGKISYDGRFIFLFNVFLNSNDPANRLRSLDIGPLRRLDQDRDTTAYSPGDVIRSSGITMTWSDGQVHNINNR
jgi:hypothetical protein